MKKRKSLFAENIARLRKEKGWTQEDLASYAGLSVGFIKQIETDVTEGSTVTRQAIADALGCTKEALYQDPQVNSAGGTAHHSSEINVTDISPDILGNLVKDIAEDYRSLIKKLEEAKALIAHGSLERDNLLARLASQDEMIDKAGRDFVEYLGTVSNSRRESAMIAAGMKSTSKNTQRKSSKLRT